MKSWPKFMLLALTLTLGISMLTPAVSAKDTTVVSPQSYGVDNLNNEEGNLYVAYLGGSITEGAGGTSSITYKDNAGSGHARWSSQLTKRYFAQKYPNKNVIEVNAGVGGTTSDLGLFRMQKDIIDKCGSEGPDVVFVEFAVNDTYTCVTNPVESQKRMEGIVRQLAALPKQPVIIFVYTASYREETSPIDGMTGFDPCLESAEVHKQVADYYGLGSINLCEYVAGGEDIEGNEIVWHPKEGTNVGDSDRWQTEGTWTGDGTHPNDTGYTGYTDYMMKLFDENADDYFKKLTWQSNPMSGYEFGKPTTISHRSDRATYTGTWTLDTSTLTGRFGDGARKTTEANATVSLQFSGRSIGIYAARGQYGASASYVIDQGSSNPVTGTISNYYNTGWMGVSTMLRFDLAPGDHTIKITTNAPAAGATDRNQFIFGYFFVDEEQPDPIVSEVTLDKDGTVGINEKIQGSYTYINKAKEEGATTYQWLVSDTKEGTYQPISGETRNNYTPDASMIGKYIKFRVIPKDILGTSGAAKDSLPVLVTRPYAGEAFTASNVLYYQGDNLITNIIDGEITTKASVTNNITGSTLKVSMLTAEYIVDEQGNKTLVQTKVSTKDIAGGSTADFANTLTATAGEDRLIQTMIVANDNLEPLADVASLQGGGSTEKVIYIGTETDEDDTPISVFQINRFSDVNYIGTETDEDENTISVYQIDRFSDSE